MKEVIEKLETLRSMMHEGGYYGCDIEINILAIAIDKLKKLDSK